MFSIAFAFCFVQCDTIQTQNRRPKTVRETSPQYDKTQIKIQAYPGSRSSVFKLG